MKKVIIFILLGASLFPSCFSDKGNYDYKEINKTIIDKLEESYTVAADVGVLRIDPNINMTLADTADARFTYLWIAKYSDNTTVIVDTIGRERVLNWHADLPIHTYTLYFRIEDSNGLVEQTSTLLNISVYHSRGIMLLGEDDHGNVQAQMLTMLPGKDTVFYDNILQSSGLPPMKGAISFFHTGNNSLNYREVWVCSESGSYFVDRLSLKKNDKSFRFNDKLYFPSAEQIDVVEIAPRIKSANGETGQNGQRFYRCSNGSVYVTYFAFYGDAYDMPVNKATGESEYHKVKGPFLYTHNSFANLIWYDADNNRFLKISNGIASSGDKLIDLDGDVFKWNNSNRAYIYGENTMNTDGGSTNGNSFAIMQETGGNNAENYDYCIYKLYCTGPAKRAFYTVDRTQAPLFGQATSYAFSSKRTVVFYIAEGKLYAYDYDPSVNKNYDITLADNNDVTMIKFDVQCEPGLDYLYVATHGASSTGGTLYKYALESNLNYVQLKATPENTWGGMVKIKDMSWRGSE